jgi:transposase
VHPAQHALKDPSIEGPRAKSDGSQVAALHSFKKHEKASRKYQRRMSGKTKFSRNWKKARARVQKSHTGIANAPAKIFSTKLRRRSTKTTRSYASKTCRCST